MNASSTCLKGMKQGSAFRAMAAVCAAVLVPAAHALDPHRLLEQYIHDRWTDEQGYPGGAVNAIAQTPDGYLWLGAENGLVRFDGLTFRIFNHANLFEGGAAPRRSFTAQRNKLADVGQQEVGSGSLLRQAQILQLCDL